MKGQPRPTTDLPEIFLSRMADLLGDDNESFLSSLLLPALTGLRVNTLKVSPEEFLQRSSFELNAILWCPGGFVVEPDAEIAAPLSLGKHPYHAAGLYYLQEPSAMAAAVVLAPQIGETVLDLAAAPGGKATHLASLLQNTGLLVANELHPRRVWDLVENLERCGVVNAVVTNDSPEKLALHFGAYFDRVLLDAPCSGEGMLRKSATARKEWKPELVKSCAIRQLNILEQAAQMVKPGGKLAYTTCTFSVEENEGVIARFLSRHPEFDLAPITPAFGFQPARPEWVNLPTTYNLNRAIRIWPHLTLGEGHFIALLAKQGSIKSDIANHAGKYSPNPKEGINSELPKPSRSILEEFCQANLDIAFKSSRTIQDGSYIYQLPEVPRNLTGLKVIRPGWWLGTINKGRFTPSHSLALGMKMTHVQRSLSLEIGDPRLSAYLAGQSFPNQGKDGWILVTVDNFPLGWGKLVHNVIKNYYPHGLRRLG